MHGVAGADPTDHRALAAGLPPIDSIDHWGFLTGKTAVSPRNTIPLGSCSAAPDEDAFCQTKGNMPATVNGVVSYLGAGADRRLWKLLVGRIPLAGWTGPRYPNGTGAVTPTVDCGTGCAASKPHPFFHQRVLFRPSPPSTPVPRDTHIARNTRFGLPPKSRKAPFFLSGGRAGGERERELPVFLFFPPT